MESMESDKRNLAKANFVEKAMEEDAFASDLLQLKRCGVRFIEEHGSDRPADKSARSLRCQIRYPLCGADEVHCNSKCFFICDLGDSSGVAHEVVEFLEELWS